MSWRKSPNPVDTETVSVSYEEPKRRAGRRKFPLSSVLLPILFLFLHQIVLNVMAYLRVFIYAIKTGLMGDDLVRVLSRPDLLIEFFMESDAQNIGSIWAMLILIPIYLLYLFLRRRRDPGVLRLQKQGPRTFIESAVLILGTMGMTQLWMTFLLLFREAENFFGQALRDYMSQAEMLTSSGSKLWIQVLALAVLVPIAEELLFRGIIQGELSLRYSRKVTVIVSSLVFAVFHFNLVQGTYVLFAGIILALAYEFTNNLLVPIFMHMVFNFIGGGILQEVLDLSESGGTVLLVIMLLAIPLACAVLIIWYKRDKAKRISASSGLEQAGGGQE